MSFIDYLEELRCHLVRAFIALLVFTFIGFFMMDIIYRDIILAPMRPNFWTFRQMCNIDPSFCITKIDFHLQNRTLTGQFMMHFKSAFVFGIICSFPYTVWEIWRFIKPGLYPNEKKGASGAVFFVSLLFIIGILFGYFIITPLSFNFLINYKIDESIPNIIYITNYISLFTALILGSGFMFQLPVLIFILSKIGIVTPELMKKYRKHAIVVNFILAAVIIPSPDFFTQIIVAFPLLLLYELSVFISAGVQRSKALEIEKQDA